MRILGALALLLAVAGGQEKEAGPQPPAEVRHEVKLKSGSLLVGKIEPEEWKVTTAFGELRVPVWDVRHVVFGRKSDSERLAQVREAIQDLASGNPDRRNHALVRLKNEGAFAARDLANAAKDHDDPEVRRLCTETLEALDLDEDEYVPDDDRVETSLFTLAGTVEPASFKVTVPELGALNVNRGDITSFRRIGTVRDVTVAVTGQNTWPNGWVDSEVVFEKGEKIRVAAKGSIRFPNWGNQVFGPDGQPNMGNINGVPMCALAGRVGESGQPFLLGSEYKGDAPQKGKLYLLMMVNLHGQPSFGEFSVTISR